MENLLVGGLAIAAGLAFCFGGYAAMRLIIPIWGLFVGFVLGVGLVAAIADEGVLVTGLGWLVGAVLALVVAAIAYLYFRLAIVLAAASTGAALGVAAMAAIGVEWTWIVVLAGIVAGVLVALLAVSVDLPAVVLIVFTSLAGAAATVFGVLLLLGTFEVDDLSTATTTELVSEEWWSYLLYVGLAIAGLIAQSRLAADIRASVREQWDPSGTPGRP